MNLFQERSTQKELIDAGDIPFADWEKCLHELNTVNTLLGGHSITIDGVKKLLAEKKPPAITIAEIGCGGGDNLKAIHRWNRNKYAFKYIGVDINRACTDFAEQNCSTLPDARFICSDYRDANFGNDLPDIIFSSLFCHHFSNESLLEMLQWMRLNSKLGFFINDLQRHPVAYQSIKLLTKIFSKSYLIKNDAPISVLRGFHKKEWEQLFHQAGIDHYSIEWKWAFRFLITVKNA